MWDQPLTARPEQLETALSGRLKIALRAAEQASATLIRMRRGIAYQRKSPIDLVTAADTEAEAQILAEVRACFPADAILAEEADGDIGCERMRPLVAKQPWTWAIDPLDGTTNYAHGLMNFAVSIGVMRFGRPVLGVVAAPARREIFVGGASIPATCNGAPIAVSVCAHIESALLATGFPYDRRERVDELLQPLRRALLRSHGVRRAGAAAIDLCEVAAGRLDGFWEVGLHPWDVVAGQAIIEAAGGRLSDYLGAEHDVFAARTVASNGHLHSQVLELL